MTQRKAKAVTEGTSAMKSHIYAYAHFFIYKICINRSLQTLSKESNFIIGMLKTHAVSWRQLLSYFKAGGRRLSDP